jgi:hypothetical protein
MTPTDHIIAKQLAWATNRALKLTGSSGDSGRPVYTSSVNANLFQPLNKATRADLENGDGSELAGTSKKTAKIHALHSSSALGINVFDYWRGRADLSPLTSSCGLSRRGTAFNADVSFEQQFSIDDRFQYAPNIDVVIVRSTGQYKTYAIECKFTEPYSSRQHGGVDPKYFESDGIWPGLSATHQLARTISPSDNRFQFLHAAQLIKHILGLNRKFGHARYRLLYLWYDALGKPGFQHRREIEDFADIVRSDGVVFHESTYQDVIVRLAEYRNDNAKYIAYLTERYL